MMVPNTNEKNLKHWSLNVKPRFVGTKMVLLSYHQTVSETNKRIPITMEREYQTYWRGNWVFTLPFIMLLLYLFL